MSRSSFASFHLTGYGGKTLGGGTSVGGGKATAMHTSVDRLFENDDEVFLSSSYADMPQVYFLYLLKNYIFNFIYIC